MLSRTAARARSAQGASQFAAGNAAVRVSHHSDDRPVHVMKTSQVTARLCLRMSRNVRVQIRLFCPRHPFISLLRVQIGPFCPCRSSHCPSRVQIMGFRPRRWIHVCRSGSFAHVIPLFHCYAYRLGLFAPVVLHIVPHVCRSWVFAPVVGFTCADLALLPTSPFMDVVLNCVKVLLSPGCFAICRVLCRCPTMNWSARS